MDNITHSLVSAAIGVGLAKKSPNLAKPLVILALLAGNFPDLDFLYTPLISEPFGYLLHHRGHTHTLIGALPCAFLSFILILFAYKLLKQNFSKYEKLLLLFTSIISSLVHILLDSFNTYGVHPFWPFSNQWFYGDLLFIIEPSIWITLSLSLLSFTINRALKFLLYLIILAASALLIFLGKVPPYLLTFWFVFFCLSVLLLLKQDLNRKFYYWASVSTVIVTIFFCSSRIAQIHLNDIIKDKDNLSAFISPSPANPFCWSYLQIFQQDENIIYSRGNLQLVREFFDLKCEQYSIYNNQKNYLNIPIQKFTEYKDNCRWQAFLQFSRAPSIIECANQDCTADQRFNRQANNFSVKPLSGECPNFLPPWEAPVKNLLRLKSLQH